MIPRSTTICRNSHPETYTGLSMVRARLSNADKDQAWFRQRDAVRQQLGESRYWELMFVRQLLSQILNPKARISTRRPMSRSSSTLGGICRKPSRSRESSGDRYVIPKILLRLRVFPGLYAHAVTLALAHTCCFRPRSTQRPAPGQRGTSSDASAPRRRRAG